MQHLFLFKQPFKDHCALLRSFALCTLTVKRLGGGVVSLTPLWFFQRCVLYRQGENLLFCDFLSSLKVSLKILKLLRKYEDFLLSILTIFIYFLRFFTFPCCKETNSISI